MRLLSGVEDDDLAFLPTSTEEVDDIILDIALLESGCEVHYAVDSHEILNFCFPLVQAHEMHIARAAMIDSVVALYEVFYNRSNKAILLDEYIYELTERVRVIQDKMTQWRAQAGQMTLEKLAPGAESGRAEKVDLGRDFSVILATAMGLLGPSFERLKEVWRDRLARDEGDDSHDRVIAEIFSRNRGSSFISTIADELYRKLVRTDTSRFMRERIRRSSFVDAYAADRLHSINRAAEEAFRNKRLSCRHVFFYLSSAERSRTLFEILYEKKGRPLVENVELSLWRTPQQLLLRMISEEATTEETRRNLETIKRIIRTRQGIPFDLPTHKLEPELESYKRKIDIHYAKGKNFGLLSLLTGEDHYGKLLAEAGEGQDAKRACEILKDIIDTPQWTEENARASSRENFFFTSAKESLLQGLANLATPNEVPHAVRPGGDAVAASAQHLPSVFRVDPISPYDVMLDDIKVYFRTPIQGRPGSFELIRVACKQFLDRDGEVEAFQEDHEFIRCLLFLALPTPDADSFAFKHAIEIIAKLNALPMGTESETRIQRALVFEKEFHCLACWAARRMMSYRDAENRAEEAICKYESDPDPRFHHARCLNIFAWFDAYGRGEARKPSQGLSIAVAISEAERAIELYRTWGVACRDQVAALYNTIACLYIYRLDSLFDINKARENLVKLKNCLDREQWFDRYPEYFHTEAFLEYEEELVMEAVGNSIEARIEKLLNAKWAIDFAYRIYQGNEGALLKHRDLIVLLRDKITLKIRELRGQVRNAH